MLASIYFYLEGSLGSPRWSSDVPSVSGRNDHSATNNPQVICLRSVYRGKRGRRRVGGSGMKHGRDERVMKRIRERSRSCVALSKKLLPGISFSLAKRRGISPPSQENFSFSPHYLYARFGYLPEFSANVSCGN